MICNIKTKHEVSEAEIELIFRRTDEWMSICKTFLSAVHTNESLSNIEKFTYLKGYLQNEAVEAIKGLYL